MNLRVIALPVVFILLALVAVDRINTGPLDPTLQSKPAK